MHPWGPRSWSGGSWKRGGRRRRPSFPTRRWSGSLRKSAWGCSRGPKVSSAKQGTLKAHTAAADLALNQAENLRASLEDAERKGTAGEIAAARVKEGAV